MIWGIILSGIVLYAIVAVMVNLLGYEKQIVEKAQEKKNSAMFYHALAKLTFLNYDGYNPTDKEKKVMEEFVKQPSEYDSHPIGSYFKLCNDNVNMLKSIKLPRFKISELGIGFTVMLLFVASVALGIMFG